MAFAGCNVTFRWFITQAGAPIAPIYGPMTSSNLLASTQTTSNAAPSSPANANMVPMASVYADVPYWITVGPSPADPNVDNPAGGRTLIPAATPFDFFCSGGDKVRCVLA